MKKILYIIIDIDQFIYSFALFNMFRIPLLLDCFYFKDLILSCRDTFSSIKPSNNIVQVTRDTICQFMCQPHNYYICRLISCIYTLHIRIYECGLKLYRLKLYNGILECDVIKS